MSNPSTSVTFGRRGSLGAATKPFFRGKKASGPSCKLRRYDRNHLVKTRGEVVATEAFHEMFVTSRPKFIAMAYSILRNTEDAEDAVQNAFISGHLHLHNFQGRSALKTWFTRVVLNAALMIRRKRKPVQLVSAPEQATVNGSKWLDGIPSPEPDPEMCWAKSEALGLIEELTAQLNPRLRTAFLMYYANDMSVSEARSMAGVSVSTFKARLFRARRQVIRKAKRALVLRPQRQASDGFSLVVD